MKAQKHSPTVAALASMENGDRRTSPDAWGRATIRQDAGLVRGKRRGQHRPPDETRKVETL